MFKGKNLKQLQDLSRMAVESSKQLDSQIGLINATISETLKNANESEKPEIENIMALTTKAINLAKQGKSDQAQELIKTFENGRKNNK